MNKSGWVLAVLIGGLSMGAKSALPAAPPDQIGVPCCSVQEVQIPVNNPDCALSFGTWSTRPGRCTQLCVSQTAPCKAFGTVNGQFVSLAAICGSDDSENVDCNTGFWIVAINCGDGCD